MQPSQEHLERLGVRFVRENEGIAEFLLLSNDLKIILVERHSAPVVTTQIMYRVGSRHEGPGTTGATHFTEHLMFKSTDRFDRAKGLSIDDVLKPAGGDYNAYTCTDNTTYVSTVPRESLNIALAVEADRMRNLKFSKEIRDSEMTVVRNEFEIGENDIDDLLHKTLMSTAIREHPYHHPVIGWRSDVENVSLKKLKGFYDTFYWPNNAVLVLVGDFASDEALTAIVAEFGQIPRSPHAIPEVHTVEPAQEGARNFELRREGLEDTRLIIGFRAPQATDPNFFPMVVLSEILGGSHNKSSRLYKALVETNLASDVSIDMSESLDPSLFIICATPTRDDYLDKLERALLAELDQLKRRRVTARELARVQRSNRNQSAAIFDDTNEIADHLLTAESVASDWNWFVDYDNQIDAVTAAAVQKAARRYFVEDSKTTGRARPAAKKPKSEGLQSQIARAPETSENSPVPTPDSIVRFVDRAVPEARSAVTPTNFAERIVTSRLANGLTINVLPQPGSGVVTVCGGIKAGAYFAPGTSFVIADLTRRMLDCGTRRFTKTRISHTLEEIGAGLSFSMDEFFIEFESTFVPTELSRFVSILSSVLIEPMFSRNELTLAKADLSGELRTLSADTEAVAKAKLAQAMYKPDHIFYRRSNRALLKDVKTVRLSEIRNFHAQCYVPSSTVLTVVGDVDAETVLTLLEKQFGAWSGAEPREIAVPDAQPRTSPRRVDVKVPGKANVDIIISVPVVLSHDDPEYMAARLACNAVGIETMGARLGATIREKYGLTYGVYCYFEDTEYGGGRFTVSLSVNPSNVDRAIKLVHAVIEDFLTNGITAKELSDEASRSYGKHVLSLRHSHGLAGAINLLAMRERNFAALDNYWKVVHQPTIEEVNAAARRHMRLENALTVVVGSL